MWAKAVMSALSATRDRDKNIVGEPQTSLLTLSLPLQTGTLPLPCSWGCYIRARSLQSELPERDVPRGAAHGDVHPDPEGPRDAAAQAEVAAQGAQRPDYGNLRADRARTRYILVLFDSVLFLRQAPQKVKPSLILQPFVQPCPCFPSRLRFVCVENRTLLFSLVEVDCCVKVWELESSRALEAVILASGRKLPRKHGWLQFRCRAWCWPRFVADCYAQ